MTARTTLAMDQELLNHLKAIAHEKHCRSLSELVKDILKNYLEAYQTRKLYQKMAKNYQTYAKTFSDHDFRKMEECALEDLLNKV